jgi:hypothetical protein
MSNYAPADEKGDKPFVVERSGWGKKSSRLVYAANVSQAKFKAFGRMGTGEYITGCRRATPEDVQK